MSFVMFGNFQKYCGWQMNVVETCQKFYKKYERYPTYIRMSDKTLDALFDEDEKAFQDPYSKEHAVYDSNGEILLPLAINQDYSYSKPGCLTQEHSILLDNYSASHPLSEDDELWQNYEDDSEQQDDAVEQDDSDSIYPIEFGVNEDRTVSFITNKFELLFMEGNGMPDDYYIVQLGDGPDDGGEDFDESETEETAGKLRLVA